MNSIYLGLLLLSLVLIEVLSGGANLLSSFPSSAVLSFTAVLTLASLRRPQVPASGSALLGSAIFFGYVLIRILTSPVEYLTHHDLFSVLGALIVYLIISLHLTTPKHRFWLIVALLFLGLVNIAFGAVQYFRGQNSSFLSFIPSSNYGSRAAGLYGCPDHLAGFFEVVGLLGLSTVCWGRGKHLLKILLGYASLMCLGGVVLTGSRGGAASTACGFFVFLLLSLITLRKAAVVHKWLMIACTVLAAAMLVGGAVYFMSSQVHLRLRWGNLHEKTDNRFDMWEAALDQFKLQPIVGTGDGTYLYYQRHFRKPMRYQDAIYAHNDYLQLLAEFGLIGFAAFLFFFGTHVVHGIRSFAWFINERLNSLGRMRSDTLALIIGSLSALTTYVVHSLFDFNLHIPANALVLAIVFGILANPGIETPFTVRRPEWLNRIVRLTIPAFGLCLGLASLPTWPGEYYARQARTAVGDEDFATGAELARKGISHTKSNPYLYAYLGDALFELGEQAATPEAAELRYKGAMQSYKRGLALFPQDRYLLLGMGWSLDALKRFEESEPYFKQIVGFEPNSSQISAYYGAHLHAWGKLDEAEAEYNRSMKLGGNPMAQGGLNRLAEQRAAAAAPPAPSAPPGEQK